MAKKNYKLFTIDYLCNSVLTDEDLHYLFDTPSLNYSLVTEMFKFIGDTRKPTDIINISRTDKEWMYKYYWTTSQREEFEILLTKAIKNIYSYSEEESKSKAQWWITIYGLTNNCMKKHKKFDKI